MLGRGEVEKKSCQKTPPFVKWLWGWKDDPSGGKEERRFGLIPDGNQQTKKMTLRTHKKPRVYFTVQGEKKPAPSKEKGFFGLPRKRESRDKTTQPGA